MKLRIVSFILTAVMLTTLMIGCGGSQNTTPKETTPAQQSTPQPTAAQQPAKEEKVEISAYIWCPDFIEEAQKIVDAFMKRYPNIKVDFTPMSGQSVMACLQPRVAANTLPDFISMNGDEYGHLLAKDGYLLDLGKTAVWDNMLDSLKPQWTTDKDVKFGISGGVATTFVYYNKDMFKKAGIEKLPENWDEFLATCEALKKSGVTPIIVPGSHESTMANTFVTFSLANQVAKNPDFMKSAKEGKLNYNSPEIIDIYSKVKTLVDKGYLQTGVMSTDYLGSVTMFVQGKGAMILNGSWLAGQATVSKTFETGIMLAPWNAKGDKQVPIMSSETGFSISAKSPKAKQEAAMKLLEFWNGEGHYMYQNKRKNIPAFKADKVVGKVDMVPQIVDIMKLTSTYPVTAPLSFAYLPAVISTESRKMVQNVLSGSTTPEAAAKALDELAKKK